tara:strand:- start:52 stop:327 length:276 start_codon:yes stop_codon:yes gene_type:complete
MKIFITKILIASFIFYILFELTIGSRIDNAQSFFEQFKSKGERTKVKEKILSEMEKANQKESILNNRERKIISDFIEKIQKELKTEEKNKN